MTECQKTMRWRKGRGAGRGAAWTAARRLLLVAPLLLGGLATARAQDPAEGRSERKTISSLTARLQKIDGFIPLYWDGGTGRLWMEISRFDEEFLYQISLPAGVGSNPIGLDRGQLGAGAIVAFERIGAKVLLVQPNYRYRALSDDAAERRAVADSFARSVLWGFRVEASEGERVLVDATAFFVRDAHGVAERLRGSRQGAFRFDEGRSAIHLPRTKGFPLNTEVESIVTLVGEDAGALLRSVTPSPQAVTVRQHHSLVRLPEPGYRPRRHDPRVSAMAHTFHDYASPFDQPIETRWIRRHRLQKKDPSASISEAVEPIVYYVDNGVPEPIRSALVEGASWWAAAFEAAGFRNAYQVKVLPEGADPMDIRYHMINWVHRSTRGWSYGASVVDPRTGEIIKGNVSLGSLRIRQDMLLGTGLIAPELMSQGQGQNGAELHCLAAESPSVDYLTALSAGDPATDSVAMSLARIRQLSAHEVGHTLGFSHNFAASSYGRASVMDYPAPYVQIVNGKLDLSRAYTTEIGPYDRFSVRYAYAQFPQGTDETAALDALLAEGAAAGMLFIDDADGRDIGTAHPLASVWDNGDDAIAMLRQEMEVRRIGLAGFGLANLAPGQPLAELEAKLLPLYLHHRYQLAAAAKSVGGAHFSYAVKQGLGAAAAAHPTPVREIVAPQRQREALQAILETLRPEVLTLPARILSLLPPVPPSHKGGPTEYFGRRTEPVFDLLGAASIAAGLTFDALLAPARAERLVAFHAEDPRYPGLREVLGATIKSVWSSPLATASDQRAIQLTLQALLLGRLMDLAAHDAASPLVRAEASEALRGIQTLLKTPTALANPDPTVRAHRRWALDELERFLTRPAPVRQPSQRLPTPAGDPIGQP